MSHSHAGELSSAEPPSGSIEEAKDQAYHGKITQVEDLEESEKGHGYVRDPNVVNSHHKSGVVASLVRKVDAALVPLAALVFLIAYMVCAVILTIYRK